MVKMEKKEIEEALEKANGNYIIWLVIWFSMFWGFLLSIFKPLR